jgi:hypothetical protein
MLLNLNDDLPALTKLQERLARACAYRMVAALDRFDVSQAEQSELLSALAGMKGDIVGV